MSPLIFVKKKKNWQRSCTRFPSFFMTTIHFSHKTRVNYSLFQSTQPLVVVHAFSTFKSFGIGIARIWRMSRESWMVYDLFSPYKSLLFRDKWYACNTRLDTRRNYLLIGLLLTSTRTSRTSLKRKRFRLFSRSKLYGIVDWLKRTEKYRGAKSYLLHPSARVVSY